MRETDTFNESAAVIAYPDRRVLPPERLIVLQFTEGNTQIARCHGPIKRTWVYEGTDFVEQSGHTNLPATVTRWRPFIISPGRAIMLTDQYFNQSCISFYISEDRKRVVFIYMLGPLYGRACIYAVTGQGSRGEFDIAPNTQGWSS